MNLKDKKLTVLHQLSQESEIISLLELLEKMGKDYTERSVRRWLGEMVQEGLVERIGDKRGARYRIAHKAKRNNDTLGIGLDVIRVRYRQQRRALLGEIIRNKLTGKPMHGLISDQAKKMIKQEDQKNFIEDIVEDLKHIDQSRIVGLGVTPDQLNEWMIEEHRF